MCMPTHVGRRTVKHDSIPLKQTSLDAISKCTITIRAATSTREYSNRKHYVLLLEIRQRKFIIYHLFDFLNFKKKTINSNNK